MPVLQQALKKHRQFVQVEWFSLAERFFEKNDSIHDYDISSMDVDESAPVARIMGDGSQYSKVEVSKVYNSDWSVRNIQKHRTMTFIRNLAKLRQRAFEQDEQWIDNYKGTYINTTSSLLNLNLSEASLCAVRTIGSKYLKVHKNDIEKLFPQIQQKVRLKFT